MSKTVEAPHYSEEDYQAFQVFLRTACGIVLGDNKQYLVVNRIRRIMVEHKLDSLVALIRLIEHERVRGLKERVIDAMTTNETFWFRDNFPFEALKDSLLPRLLKDERRDGLRIWSAACSSGQEPYSVSMIFDEFRQRNAGLINREPEIIATDISSNALAAARGATYDQLSINRGLSAERRRQYFEETDAGQFRLKSAIASRVSFRQLNLQNSFSGLGNFDIIFCRNVLIYFAADLKADILERMHASLKPNSYLILGASESMPAKLANLYRLERLSNNITVYRS